MKLKLFQTLLLGLTLLSCSQSRFGQWRPSVTEDDRLKGSYRFERNGWIYVHLEGAPEQIGYQHGRLLAKETADLLRGLKPFRQHETNRVREFYSTASRYCLSPQTSS